MSKKKTGAGEVVVAKPKRGKGQSDAEPMVEAAPAAPVPALQDLALGYLQHLEDVGKSLGTVASHRIEIATVLDELGRETLARDLTPTRVLEFLDCDRVNRTRTGVPTVECRCSTRSGCRYKRSRRQGTGRGTDRDGLPRLQRQTIQSLHKAPLVFRCVGDGASLCWGLSEKSMAQDLDPPMLAHSSALTPPRWRCKSTRTHVCGVLAASGFAGAASGPQAWSSTDPASQSRDMNAWVNPEWTGPQGLRMEPR